MILLAHTHPSEAELLVPVTSAHVSGASYKMIGDPGLEFLEDFARDARVTVPTTVNPLGTDLRQWRDLGIPAEFADKQERIARAYGSMGVRPSFTCTPYLVGARPGFGEHVAWAESNAVCFANSVLGARTNREGGPSALAAAIVGATPDYGLHKDEGRRPTVRVNVTTKPHGLDFSLVGLVAGQRVGDGLPFFRGFHGSEEDLKWLGASRASTGSCAMFHLEDVTPEARRARTAGLPSITISRRDLVEAQRSFTDGTRPDVIALGSPQLSGQELWGVADRVRRKPPRIPVWVFTSRAVRDENPEPVAAIESHGAAGGVNAAAEGIVAVGPMRAGIPMVDGIDVGGLENGDTVRIDGDRGTVELPGVRGRSVVSVVLRNRGRILLVRRSAAVGTFRGQWSAISGYMEGREDPKSRAIREVREETGLRGIRFRANAAPILARDGATMFVVHPLLFDAPSRRVRLDWENVEYRWIRPEEINRYETVPRLPEVVAAVLRMDRES